MRLQHFFSSLSLVTVRGFFLLVIKIPIQFIQLILGCELLRLKKTEKLPINYINFKGEIMITGQSIKIIRKKEVLTITGLSKSSLHLRINDETMVPSISLGERAVGFIESEVQAVLAAMVAGKNKDELRLLVRDLVAKRQQLAA